MTNRPKYEDEILPIVEAIVPFAVWPKVGTEADARTYCAATARQATEQRARDDYSTDSVWPIAYCARDGVTGRIWSVLVGVVVQPSFVALDAYEVPMPLATHVLWGGHVLCEDKRLRGIPRDWPPGQSWISLKDIADGADIPSDHCEACWGKAPGLVAGLRPIGTN